MNSEFKPKDYNSVSPYILVNGALKFIDLMKKIFDAKELRRFDMEGGAVMHAEIRIDDSVIMVADSSDQFPPVPSVLHVYVSDVDATFKRAKNAGCEIIKNPLQLKDDIDRRGTFVDFAGNMWSVATEIKYKYDE